MKLKRSSSVHIMRVSIGALSLSPLQLSIMHIIYVLQHNKPGDWNTLLDAFFGMFSIVISRYLDRRGRDVVTPTQSSYEVVTSLPNAAIPLITLGETESVSTFVCENVVSCRVLKSVVVGISKKRRFE